MNLWVKMWPLKIFHGTLRVRLKLAERGLWYELVFLAKICPIAEMFPANEYVAEEHVEKLISANETTPYPREYLAEFFGVELDWLEMALDKLKAQHLIREDARGIWIVDWEDHQGEYDRQKIYRQRQAKTRGEKHGHFKDNGPVNAPVCEKCGTKNHMEPVMKKGGGMNFKCGKCDILYVRPGSKWVKEEDLEK